LAVFRRKLPFLACFQAKNPEKKRNHPIECKFGATRSEEGLRSHRVLKVIYEEIINTKPVFRVQNRGG
jgi:hypothetical protein